MATVKAKMVHGRQALRLLDNSDDAQATARALLRRLCEFSGADLTAKCAAYELDEKTGERFIIGTRPDYDVSAVDFVVTKRGKTIARVSLWPWGEVTVPKKWR